MANLEQFGVTRATAANVNVPIHTIAGRLTDDSGNVLADFTGPNALQWPGVLAELSAAQQDQIAQQVAPLLVNMRAGR